MTSPELHSMTSFQVTVSYGRQQTTFDIWGADRATPVARLYRAGAYDSLRALQLLVGPQLADIAGYVTERAAYAPDRTELGTVNSRFGAPRRKRWSVAQPGLPVLTAHPTGASATRYRFPFSLVLTGVANNVLPFNFLFDARDSTGFVVSRSGGVRAKFAVTVHDSRVDRRLVLATVVALNRFESSDVRQEAIDLTANPFNT
jgi:hypothetical protein